MLSESKMLKPIDLLVGLKILTNDPALTQMELASRLCISSSQVNSAIKILVISKLLNLKNNKPVPIVSALEEFVLSGVKYCYPVKVGELTIGVPTAYAAEPLVKEIAEQNDPIPVWPYVAGGARGLALEPLHKNVPKALSEFPDPELFVYLVLIDALRIGRAREKNLAVKYLRQQFAKAKEKLKGVSFE